jgi:hypothetical protein
MHVRLLIKIYLIGHFSFNTPCVSFLLTDKTPSKIFRKCYHMYLITQQIRDRLIFWKVIDPADSLFIQNSVRDLLVCTSDVIFIKQSHSCLIIMFTSENLFISFSFWFIVTDLCVYWRSYCIHTSPFLFILYVRFILDEKNRRNFIFRLVRRFTNITAIRSIYFSFVLS